MKIFRLTTGATTEVQRGGVLVHVVKRRGTRNTTKRAINHGDTFAPWQASRGQRRSGGVVLRRFPRQREGCRGATVRSVGVKGRVGQPRLSLSSGPRASAVSNWGAARVKGAKGGGRGQGARTTGTPKRGRRGRKGPGRRGGGKEPRFRIENRAEVPEPGRVHPIRSKVLKGRVAAGGTTGRSPGVQGGVPGLLSGNTANRHGGRELVGWRPTGRHGPPARGTS